MCRGRTTGWIVVYHSAGEVGMVIWFTWCSSQSLFGMNLRSRRMASGDAAIHRATTNYGMEGRMCVSADPTVDHSPFTHKLFLEVGPKQPRRMARQRAEPRLDERLGWYKMRRDDAPIGTTHLPVQPPFIVMKCGR